MAKKTTVPSADNFLKVGIITSGGDSPGMNTAIYTIARHCLYFGFQPFVVYEGYRGLVQNNIHPINILEAEAHSSHGGTYIYTSRLPEFKQLKVRQQAVKNLKARGINTLVIVGGDGSYQGAKALSEMGINCICLPGTIDNDIGSSDFTIGFHTALDSIDRATDQIVETCVSHKRVALIEVMGRYCGDLALYSGLTSGADLIITSENYISDREIANKVKTYFTKHPQSRAYVIIVTERMYGHNGNPTLEEVAQKILKATGYKTNINRLGYLQRGGRPSTMDRVLAIRMGMHAVELIAQNKKNRVVGICRDKIVDYSIAHGLKMVNPKRIDMVEKINKIQEKV